MSTTVKLTLATVRAQLALVGVCIRSSEGEYRVNFRNGSESTAYYTTELDDALATGNAMATAANK